MLTFEQIKELIEMVGQQRLQRVEIERSGFRLVIDGQDAPRAERVVVAESPPVEAVPRPVVASPAEPVAAVVPAAAAPVEAAEEPAEPDGSHVLHSPIVGTFYAAPNPDAEPYAKVGDRVKIGQVLCIVEAMKLMNEIESDVDGVLRKIHPQNAQPVEFGEPLFSIDPD